MEIILRARNCDVASKVKDEARRKVEHATRFFDRITDLEVSFAEETNRRIPEPATVEITARSKKHTVRAIGAGQDHSEAIDQAVARFERQLRRYKTRMVDRGRRAKPDDARITGELPELRTTRTPGEAAEDPEPTIVRRKAFELSAMQPDDAVLQLELLGHEFYLFINADTDQPNVVYRRGDGDIGLIEGVAAVGAGVGGQH